MFQGRPQLIINPPTFFFGNIVVVGFWFVCVCVFCWSRWLCVCICVFFLSGGGRVVVFVVVVVVDVVVVVGCVVCVLVYSCV